MDTSLSAALNSSAQPGEHLSRAGQQRYPRPPAALAPAPAAATAAAALAPAPAPAAAAAAVAAAAARCFDSITGRAPAKALDARRLPRLLQRVAFLRRLAQLRAELCDHRTVRLQLLFEPLRVCDQGGGVPRSDRRRRLRCLQLLPRRRLRRKSLPLGGGGLPLGGGGLQPCSLQPLLGGGEAACQGLALS